jgi:outer membrane receptor protein involved in Fe transport
MAPGTANGGSCADISQVPALLIKRVEVLTGGATSVYGSDALAGVVNFILDDEFVGVKASATKFTIIAMIIISLEHYMTLIIIKKHPQK